jgi:tetratricopeptide (TPR) repeat protein
MSCVRVLASLLLASSAPTELQRRALALQAEGVQLYRHGDFEGAIRAFRAADGLAPRPEYLFNIAQSYRRMKDCPRALESYREYVRIEPKAATRPRVVEALAEMDACVRQPPPVEATADAGVEQVPAEELDNPPPEPRLAVTAPEPTLPPRPVSSPGVALLAAGLASTGVGAGLWGSAVSDYHQLQGACGTACAPASIVNPERKLYAGYTAVGVGAAAAAAGAALILCNRASPVAAWVLPSGAGICVAGTLGP